MQGLFPAFFEYILKSLVTYKFTDMYLFPLIGYAEPQIQFSEELFVRGVATQGHRRKKGEKYIGYTEETLQAKNILVKLCT